MTDCADDVFVSSHKAVMHNALCNVKRQMHNDMRYAKFMSDPAERLRIARVRAGFATAKEAAEAMGFPVSTYLAHENGSRGYPAKKAFTYARKYKVPEQWLLYGSGKAPGSDGGMNAEIHSMVDRLPPVRQKEALRILRVLVGDDEA